MQNFLSQIASKMDVESLQQRVSQLEQEKADLSEQTKIKLTKALEMVKEYKRQLEEKTANENDLNNKLNEVQEAAKVKLSKAVDMIKDLKKQIEDKTHKEIENEKQFNELQNQIDLYKQLDASNKIHLENLSNDNESLDRLLRDTKTMLMQTSNDKQELLSANESLQRELQVIS